MKVRVSVQKKSPPCRRALGKFTLPYLKLLFPPPPPPPAPVLVEAGVVSIGISIAGLAGLAGAATASLAATAGLASLPWCACAEAFRLAGYDMGFAESLLIALLRLGKSLNVITIGRIISLSSLSRIWQC